MDVYNINLYMHDHYIRLWKPSTMMMWVMWRHPSKSHSLLYVYTSVETRESYMPILALVLVITYLKIINRGKWQSLSQAVQKKCWSILHWWRWLMLTWTILMLNRLYYHLCMTLYYCPMPSLSSTSPIE